MNQSFEGIAKFNQNFVNGTMKSAAVWTNGVQAVAAETTEYTKSSMENGASAFEKMTSAKSAEKAFEVQSEFAKSAFEGAVAQATKVGEIYTDMTKDLFKPFEAAFNKAK